MERPGGQMIWHFLGCDLGECASGHRCEVTQRRGNRQVQKGWRRRLRGCGLEEEGGGEPLEGLELFTEGPDQICVWEDR